MSRTRLQRKAAKLSRDENERAFDTELAAARTARDKRLTKTRREFEKAVAELRSTFNSDRKDIGNEFEQIRAEIIKKYAAEEAVAA